MHKLEEFGVTKHIGKLENGVRVVLFKRPRMPISTSISFKAGAQYDPKGKEGLAHFTEHMLFQKTEKFGSNAEVGGYIEKLGGYLNAWTSSDDIRFLLEIPEPEDYSKVAFFVDQVFGHLMIENNRVENERGVILREYGDKISNPQNYIYTLSDLVFFQGSTVGRPVLGDDKTISGIKTSDLEKFYRDRLSLDSMSIVVSGDLDLDSIIESFNNELSIEKHNFKDKVVPSLDFVERENRTLIKRYEDTDQVHLTFGFRNNGYFSEDHFILYVLSVICGYGFTSSLFDKLRNKNGLVYSVYVDYWPGCNGGAWMVVTSTPKGKVQKLLDITSEEFKRVYEGGIKESELKLAKDKIIKSTRRKMQSSRSWVAFHEFGELFGPGKSLDLDEYLNIIERITLDDLTRVGKKYFKPGSWYIAMCGDIEKKDFKVNY